MYLTLEIDREADGRFIAEVPDLPGVLAYGGTKEEAVAGAQALALRVLADRLEMGSRPRVCCRSTFAPRNPPCGRACE